MNMGSKEETHTDLSVNRMFGDNDNMYMEELIRIVNENKTMNPATILPNMLNDQMMFFNEAVFEKAGALSNVSFTAEGVTAESINSYLIQSVDSSAKYVQNFFLYDANGKLVDGSIIKTLEALNGLYTTAACSQTMYQILASDGGNKSYEVIYPSYYIDGKEYRVKVVDTYDSAKPELTTDASNFLYVTMEEINSSCDAIMPLTEIKVKIPQDDREVFAVDYHTTTNENEHVFIFTDYVIKVAESTKCFVLGLMKDFEWIDVEGDKYRKFLFARFGLAAKDGKGNNLETSMSEAEDLEIAFMTYSTTRGGDFGHLVDTVYGSSSAPKSITISGGHFSITYRGGGGGYNIYIDQGSFPADFEGQCRYIIPTSLLRKLPMKDKFDAYKEMFCTWNYCEVVVKIKWYQTKLFRFIMFIISVIVTFFTMGATAALTAVIVQIGMTIIGKFSPELAMVLGIVVGFIAGNFSGFTGTLNLVKQVVNIATHINTMAFENDLASIKNDTEKYNEETREAAKAIEGIQKEAMWTGSGYNDTVIWMGLELPYLGPDINAMSCDAGIAAEKLQNIYPK